MANKKATDKIVIGLMKLKAEAKNKLKWIDINRGNSSFHHKELVWIHNRLNHLLSEYLLETNKTFQDILKEVK